MRHMGKPASRKIKLAILLWYTGCRMDLVESYENVFSGDKENARQSSPG